MPLDLVVVRQRNRADHDVFLAQLPSEMDLRSCRVIWIVVGGYDVKLDLDFTEDLVEIVVGEYRRVEGSARATLEGSQ